MAVILTKETEREIEAKIRSGDYQTPDAVIREGLALIEARDAFRRAVAAGEAELDRGEYVTAEESRRRVRAVIERHRPRE
jgi:putative addiction module CopG family antidote